MTKEMLHKRLETVKEKLESLERVLDGLADHTDLKEETKKARQDLREHIKRLNNPYNGVETFDEITIHHYRQDHILSHIIEACDRLQKSGVQVDENIIKAFELYSNTLGHELFPLAQKVFPVTMGFGATSEDKQQSIEQVETSYKQKINTIRILYEVSRESEDDRYKQSSHDIELLGKQYRIVKKILGEVNVVIPRQIVYPSTAFIAEDFLTALKNMQAFDISLLFQVNNSPTELDSGFKACTDDLNKDLQTIQALCQKLSDVECAPTSYNHEAKPSLITFDLTMRHFEVLLKEMHQRCEQYSKAKDFPNAALFFEQYAAVLKSVEKEGSTVRLSFAARYQKDQAIQEGLKSSNSGVLTSLTIMHHAANQNPKPFLQALEKRLKKADETENVIVQSNPAAATRIDQTETKTAQVITQSTLSSADVVPATVSQKITNKNSTPKTNSSVIVPTASTKAEAAVPHDQHSTPKITTQSAQVTHDLDKSLVGAVANAIERQRAHRKGLVQWLARIGLNLRRTKGTLTQKFTIFLRQHQSDITEDKLKDYLERFKEAQQYLEQKRPNKNREKTMIDQVMKYIESGTLAEKKVLLPGFKSPKDSRDPRYRHGFEKETTRHQELQAVQEVVKKLQK